MRWITKHEAARLTGLSVHTLRKYRDEDKWQEGIHYSKLAPNNVKYNEVLILDWIANRDNPAAHERAIRQYKAALGKWPQSDDPGNEN